MLEVGTSKVEELRAKNVMSGVFGLGGYTAEGLRRAGRPPRHAISRHGKKEEP